MNDLASLSAENARPRRRGRRLLIVLLAVIVLGAVALDRAYRHAVRPERLVRLTKEHLSRFVKGQVHIGDARLALFEGIRLSDVRIDAPVSIEAGEAAIPEVETPPLFFCRRVDVRHQPLALLLGNLRIESVTAFEPTCTIVHDSTSGKANVFDLLKPGTDAPADWLEDRPRRGRDVPVLPVIELRDAGIRVFDRREGELREVEDLTLSVRARPVAGTTDRYDIVWSARDEALPEESPFTSISPRAGQSRLDLDTGLVRNIHGGLPSMSIEAVMLAVNARYDGVGAWTNLLGLGGRVRAVDYNLIGDPDGPDDRSVTIELSDAAISIPVDATEDPLPRDQRYLRFAHVHGTIVATTQALRAEFTGDFHGSPCTVRATLRSDLNELRSLDDVDFDVELTMRELLVPRIDDDAPPEQVRFVRRFRALASAYEDFDPHGTIDLDIHARKKAGADEPVTLQSGTITVLNGDAAFEHFPYRGHHMTGAIEFRPDGVFVRELRGEHDGGVITINGWMAAPNVCAELQFDIAGKNIPIDKKLFDALQPEPHHTARRFDPQGRLDIDVALLRKACVGDQRRGEWSTTVTLHLNGNQATYEDFPYPIELLHGTIIIEPDRTRVINVKGRPAPSTTVAPSELASLRIPPDAGDASIDIHGDIHFDGSVVTNIDLVVSAANIPVDGALTAALPEAMSERLRAFHPHGHFHCETRLSIDPLYRAVRHESRVSLGGLSLRHEDFPLPLHDVTGTLWIDPHRILAERVAAHHDNSVVMVNGSIDPLDPSRHTDVAIEARGVELSGEIRGALAATWRERLGDWHIVGPTDLLLNVRSEANLPVAERDTESSPWNLFGTIRLNGADIHYGQGPLRITDVSGAVSFDSVGVQGRKLTGRWGEATVQLDFDSEIQQNEQRGTIRLAATRLPLDRRVRELLPERVRGAWERLAPAGVVDLLIERLEFVRDGEKAPIWTINGRLNLHDVSLHGEPDVEDATGSLTFNGTLSDRLGGCMLSGRLELDRLNLLERRLQRYGSGWSLLKTADGAGRFTLSNAQAELYDGFVAGDLEIMMSPDQSTYNLSTTIQRAQLDMMLSNGRRLSTESSEQMTIHGLLDAHLYLSGVLGNRESRRGGGRFEISAGHIYKLPLMSAILHVLNLSLPVEKSLESAQASFYVVGNRVDLPSVSLRGNGIELAGSGSMTLPDYALDVTLVNVNPRRWARVPVLSDIVEGASREFVVLHVTGPIGRPTVRTRPLAALGDEFKKLFQRRGTPTTQVVPPSE